MSDAVDQITSGLSRPYFRKILWKLLKETRKMQTQYVSTF